MLDNIINSIFNPYNTTTISVDIFIVCLISSLISGLIISLCYRYKNNSSKSFTISIGLLPTIIAIIIMTVNGNIGTSVAVAGSFSLIRFRSSPASGIQLTTIFITLASGLLIGSGYIFYGLFVSLVLSVIIMLYNGIAKDKSHNKTLQITISENMNYNEVFDSVLKQYTNHYQLVQVKTSNMGSLFRLTYNLSLKNLNDQKEMIDQLRCRNGNLEISLFDQQNEITSL